MYHKTVLLNETIEYLNIKPDGVYFDATCGAGGCSREILNRLSQKGKLFLIDRDPEACEFCENLFINDKRVTVIQTNFSRISDVLMVFCTERIDGIVFDLGVSSHQIDTSSRGFSYVHDALLDMRMSKTGLSAYDVVNKFSKEKISKILKLYGEEPFANRIAEKILSYRASCTIRTTLELVDIIKSAVPNSKFRGHPAKKTFQALRIYVNSEFESLEKGLKSSIKLLNSAGRMCVISFHSLEDKLVKKYFIEWSKFCICPKELPVCVCDHKPIVKLIVNKPILPSFFEVKNNPRSKSAKLRVCEKI